MSTVKKLDSELGVAIEREATTLEIPKIAGYLQNHLGQKITSYLAGNDHAKTVGLWISGKVEPRDMPKTRLYYAYQAARLIIEAYDDETAKAWFFGSNTLLDDEAPAYVLRHGTTPDDLRLVIPAARNLVGAAAPAFAKAR
jgi:hypothetical protein